MTRESDELSMRNQRPVRRRARDGKVARDRVRRDLVRRLDALSRHELAAFSAMLSLYMAACGGRIPPDEASAAALIAHAADNALEKWHTDGRA